MKRFALFSIIFIILIAIIGGISYLTSINSKQETTLKNAKQRTKSFLVNSTDLAIKTDDNNELAVNIRNRDELHEEVRIGSCSIALADLSEEWESKIECDKSIITPVTIEPYRNSLVSTELIDSKMTDSYYEDGRAYITYTATFKIIKSSLKNNKIHQEESTKTIKGIQFITNEYGLILNSNANVKLKNLSILWDNLDDSFKFGKE